ncbi:uncharacterized protein LOC121400542 isoform X2 [Xenopus laevis]|uniref:Uncharacterized protein LOC121400542 isoform X2 n=1 Tax=Xenopus laevis TaxID=8355 RepID=A0A8J1MDK9_XENLA|nr:uncharacterized protein LOC121400542 isoform X2 [Xenopus laevis]XP_041439795.1 uncharacterized protein LOC121400542 isoform X2 [Xenopus laevis]
MESGMPGKPPHPKGKSLPATEKKDKTPEKATSVQAPGEPGVSASLENQAFAESLAAVIKQAVVQGFQEVATSKKRARHGYSRQIDSLSEVSEGELSEDSELDSPLGSEEGEIDMEEDSNFDLAVIEPLIKAVRQTLTFPMEPAKLSSADKLFPSLKKRSVCFPVHASIKDIIMAEWKKNRKKTSDCRKIS